MYSRLRRCLWMDMWWFHHVVPGRANSDDERKRPKSRITRFDTFLPGASPRFRLTYPQKYKTICVLQPCREIEDNMESIAISSRYPHSIVAIICWLGVEGVEPVDGILKKKNNTRQWCQIFVVCATEQRCPMFPKQQTEKTRLKLQHIRFGVRLSAFDASCYSRLIVPRQSHVSA